MNCQHANTPTQRSPRSPEGPHHAKEVCRECGRFLRWLPKPETIERLKKNAMLAERLNGCRITEWEKGFLITAEKQAYKLSPKQQAIMDRMEAEYA